MKAHSIKVLLCILLLHPFLGISQKTKDAIVINETSALKRPTLFSNLGDTFGTPDAMAIDKKGNLYLSVPNGSTFEKYGSKICVFNNLNQPVTWLDNLPLHPLTNRVHPMGMEFGPDGNLYIADNQNFANKEHQSRLLRVIVENGKPIRTEVLVQGLNFANAIRWHKDRIYISDSALDVKKQSGIYSFKMEELNKGLIQLKPTDNAPYLICKFTLKPEAKEWALGVDGIAFDKKGDLYAGNFGDGVISKIEFSPDGKVKSQKIIVDSDKLKCCDGLYYYEKTNSIYIANYDNNSVHVLDLNKNTLSLLWENGNADGSDGLLDNPCEPIIYKGKLLVVNFDSYKGEKNTEVDNFHTISSFEL
ncbi:hypothetical protein ACHRVW_23380 [Flavobacterium collinsii]|uniref:hypothetical protein n=1 Tax=Flavobacterium collinsii TaxID=1114861 RepID=UPI00375670FB